MEKEKLFTDFPPVSRQQWQQRIEKELKGRPLTDLQWHLNEEIRLDPFYTFEDDVTIYGPIPGGDAANDWLIGEYIEVSDIEVAHQQLLEGLQGGVEAPLLLMSRQLRDEDLSALFAGVKPDMISTHFAQYFSGKDPRRLFEQWIGLLQEHSPDLSSFRGSIDFDPFLDWVEPPISELAELVRYCSDKMPLFGVVQVNTRRFHTGPEQAANELAFTIAKGSEYLHQLNEAGLDPITSSRHMQFAVAVSTSYFVEISKLRALRILWAHVLKGYGSEEPYSIRIEVHQARESQLADPHQNMIRAATQAMSAVIGGADRLYLRPAAPEFRRIARNVQHILKMESFLDRVSDPGGGSYYIEKLTGRFVEEAWRQFRKIEQEGGFLNMK